MLGHARSPKRRELQNRVEDKLGVRFGSFFLRCLAGRFDPQRSFSRSFRSFTPASISLRKSGQDLFKHELAAVRASLAGRLLSSSLSHWERRIRPLAGPVRARRGARGEGRVRSRTTATALVFALPAHERREAKWKARGLNTYSGHEPLAAIGGIACPKENGLVRQLPDQPVETRPYRRI